MDKPHFNTSVRKAKRAMDSAWAVEVLKKAPFVTVSFTSKEGYPYGIPLSLATADGEIWYFHCALEGEKIDAIRTNPYVCMSAVTKCKPMAGPKDGSFTLEFQSALAFAKAEIVEDRQEKILGLRLISERFLPSHMDAFEQAIERSLDRTAVVRLTLVEPPTGKRKLYDENGDEVRGTLK